MAFQAGRWGGALAAVERGYFPVSGTGYRSLSGLHGAHGEDAAALTPEFLEALAVNQDRERRSVLARLQRPPLPGPDPLSNYVSASIDADKALEEGFFAPDAERADMWAGAFRLFTLIDADPRFQPTPRAPAWTADHCAEALARTRASLVFLRQLATGEFPAARLRRHLSASAYFALPPRAGGEPRVTLPALSAEFAFDWPALPTPAPVLRSPSGPKFTSTKDTGGDEQMPLL